MWSSIGEVGLLISVMSFSLINESIRTNECPPIKVSRRVSCTIDVLDLTSNCEAYALTAALTKSVGLHSSAGPTLFGVQTRQSVEIEYTCFEWTYFTCPLLTRGCHFHCDAPMHNV